MINKVKTIFVMTVGFLPCFVSYAYALESLNDEIIDGEKKLENRNLFLVLPSNFDIDRYESLAESSSFKKNTDYTVDMRSQNLSNLSYDNYKNLEQYVEVAGMFISSYQKGDKAKSVYFKLRAENYVPTKVEVRFKMKF